MENGKLKNLLNGKYRCAELLQQSAEKLRKVAALAYCHDIEDEALLMAQKIAVMSYDMTGSAQKLKDSQKEIKAERLARYMDGICAELEMRLNALCFDDLCTVSNDTSANDVVPSRSLIIDSGNADEARTVYQIFVPNSLYADYPIEKFDTFSVVVIGWEGDYENCDAVYRNMDEVIDFIHSDMEQRGLNP